MDATPGGLRAVDLGGTRVDPSSDPLAPTLLGPGLWSDVLGAAGSADDTHQYSYRRAIDASTVHVAVTASPLDPSGDGLAVEVVTPGGDSCDTDAGSVSSPVPQSLLGVGVSSGPSEMGGSSDPCASASELRITVTRTISQESRVISISVVEEAPATGTAESLPRPAESPTLARPLPADPDQVQPVEGADAFAEAPTLAPGTTYADRIAQGSVVLYRVRLDWGQSLAVRADLPLMDDAAVEAFGSERPGVTLSLLDPFRAVLADQVDGDETFDVYDDEEAGLLLDGTAPVAYLNRFDGLAAVAPGDYWVSLAVEPVDPEVEPLEVPVKLSVDVIGEAGAAPAYPANVVGPGGTAAPTGYDAATPYLVGDQVFAASVTGEGLEGSDEARGEAGSVSARLLSGLAVGLASLLCLAAGIVLLRRSLR